VKKHEKASITAFYVETILMIVLFILVILVLTQVLSESKQKSAEAFVKTNAVCLAQNAAHAVSASEDMEDVALLLDEQHNANIRNEGDTRIVSARYDVNMKPNSRGTMEVRISWEPEKGKLGTYVSSRIRVFWLDNGYNTPVYSLETGSYVQEKRS
jgi:hypothetical protein